MFSFTCVCLAAAVVAQAQPPAEPADRPRDPRPTVTNAGPLIPFLEGTDVFFALREDTVFEADILPHLVGFQNFTDVLDIEEQARRDRPKTVAFSFSGTPAVRLRMFEQVSRPVRTLSGTYACGFSSDERSPAGSPSHAVARITRRITFALRVFGRSATNSTDSGAAACRADRRPAPSARRRAPATARVRSAARRSRRAPGP
jgi:hypothetical protein